MFKWLQPPGQVTKQPTKVRIQGVEPGSELAHVIVNRFHAQISHFHRAQNQKWSISGLPVYASHTEQSDLRMRYTNQMGQETLTVEVSGSVLKELKEQVMIRSERDIELRGYIAIHNANIGSTVQANSEAEQQWELRINGAPVALPHTYAPGEAVVFCVDGYRPNYDSINNASNPFGHVGQPTPPHPGQDHSIRVQYPFFNIDPTNQVMIDFLGSDIVDQQIITHQPAGPITYIDIPSNGLMNLLGLNEAEVFQTSPPPDVSATSYALIYSEFFGRYAREVESSWRFPRADIDGVARKILINDDPVFRGSDFGAPATATGFIGGIRLDLRPPDYYSNENDPATQGGVLHENLIGPQYLSSQGSVEGYPISLFQGWP